MSERGPSRLAQRGSTLPAFGLPAQLGSPAIAESVGWDSPPGLRVDKEPGRHPPYFGGVMWTLTAKTDWAKTLAIAGLTLLIAVGFHPHAPHLPPGQHGRIEAGVSLHCCPAEEMPSCAASVVCAGLGCAAVVALQGDTAAVTLFGSPGRLARENHSAPKQADVGRHLRPPILGFSRPV